MNNSSDGLCTFITACRVVNSDIPWMCVDETESATQSEYTIWREQFYEDTIGKYDTDFDGMLSQDEVIYAANDDWTWPIATEIMSYNDLDGDLFISEQELMAQNWIVYGMEM